MKRLFLAYLWLVPLLVVAEQGPSALESLGLTGGLSGPDCAASCEATLSACKERCRATSARADVEHFDEPDVPVAACIADCETEASICRRDC